jgi:leucyl/phenylalanyl-tRNA--protein transferase
MRRSAANRASVWRFPPADSADEHGVVGVGADLEPDTLLHAYSSGMFPMRLGGTGGPLGWWSPDPRGVMPLDGFHASRSLQRSRRRLSLTLDSAFTDVMRACGDPERPHGWIDESFVDAYARLHALGHAHSVEVWEGSELVGGLYGVRIEHLFAGESMFHRARDASKVALWATCELLLLDGATLFDVQWTTPHLRSLGARDVPRREYLRQLRDAVG